jgi:hypothetical protein
VNTHDPIDKTVSTYSLLRKHSTCEHISRNAYGCKNIQGHLFANARKLPAALCEEALLVNQQDVQAGDLEGSVTRARTRNLPLALIFRCTAPRLSIVDGDIHLGGRPRRLFLPTRSRAAIACSM